MINKKHTTHAITKVMACVVIMIVSVIMSIAFGAREMPLDEVIKGIKQIQLGTLESIIIKTRIERTIFAFVAGCALSICGTLMQVVTRNPIADPSILGVNNGSALFVVIGIAFFGITSTSEYIFFALFGAFATAILVYYISTIGYDGATPLKLALSGVALSAVLSSILTIVILPSQMLSDKYRFWQVGSVGGTNKEQIIIALVVLLIILIISIIISPILNALSMGDDIATSLGIGVSAYRIIISVCSVILCGTITAMAGPIGFIGIIAPHIARSLFGGNYKILIPTSALIGGIILLIADTIGRVIARPGELEVGIVTAFIGAPILILMAISTKETSI